MLWRYTVFGLTVEADRAIPGLAVTTRAASADLRILTCEAVTDESWDDSQRWYVSSDCGPNGRPLLQIWVQPTEEDYRFLYDDGAEFLIDAAGKSVRARWPETLSIDDVGPYLTGPILGFALRLRGTTSLHASAIDVGGRAIAFLGPPGAGKSTTAAAFAKVGFAVLSDDIVAIREQDAGFLISPGYPWIRLWPASAEALFGSKEALPRISPDDPNWDKRFLDLEGPGLCFAGEPLPLAAIYILERRTEDEDAPRLADPGPPERLLSLVGNTYMNYLLDRRVRAREFEFLGRMARSVPIRAVVPHANADRLPGLCDLVLRDYEELTGRQARAPSSSRT